MSVGPPLSVCELQSVMRDRRPVVLAEIDRETQRERERAVSDEGRARGVREEERRLYCVGFLMGAALGAFWREAGALVVELVHFVG